MFGSQKPPGRPDELAEGRLSFNALERIERINTGNLPTTSDLSVNEFLYLESFGVKPLSLVMGSSVYKYADPVFSGIDRVPCLPGAYHLNNFNRDVLTAHELALERLTNEARALKADAVVGMNLRTRQIDIRVNELMYVGTAVSFARHTAAKYGVLTSFLPAQDFCTLLSSGYLPVRAVVGCATVAYIPDYYEHMLIEGGQSIFTQVLMGTYQNQEIGGLTQVCTELYQNLRRKYNLLLGPEIPGHTLMGVKVTFEREEFTVGVPRYNFVPGSLDNEAEPVGSFLLSGTLTGTLVTRVDVDRPSPPVLPVLWLKN